MKNYKISLVVFLLIVSASLHFQTSYGGERIRLYAEDYSILHGDRIKIYKNINNDFFIGWIMDDDWVRFDSVDFGSRGINIFQAKVASATNGGEISIRLDKQRGEEVGVCRVYGTGDWENNWDIVFCKLDKTIRDTRDVYLRFYGEDFYLFNIRWIQFSR